jgi:hypothetical protein
LGFPAQVLRESADKIQATHQATLRLLHLYLACNLFIEAMFERAGDYFIRGKVDPRLLVRAFPAFRGKLIGSAEEVEVYEGLREILADLPTAESLSMTLSIYIIVPLVLIRSTSFIQHQKKLQPSRTARL